MHRLTRRQMLLAAACGFGLLAPVATGRADVESPRVVLGPGAKGLVVGPGMNAAGRDLRGSQFVTQDLSGAVFDGCNLYGVRIDDCILKGASFRGAIFAGADVEVGLDDRADFTDATINGNWRGGAEGFDLYGPELSPRQLMSTWSYKNKDLRQSQVYGSVGSEGAASLDFGGADLREATLRGDCSKCDFTNARIFGAFFGNDSITFEQLASTWDYKQRRLRIRLYSSGRLEAASTEKWDFSGIDLAGSNLWFLPSAADFTDATINDCTIRNGLTKTQLYSTRSYQQGNLTGLRLTSSDLSDCDLSGMNLTNCSFSQCKYARTNFEDAVITGASLDPHGSTAEPDGLTLDQIKSTWNYKHARMEGIRLPTHIADALTDERAPQ